MAQPITCTRCGQPATWQIVDLDDGTVTFLCMDCRVAEAVMIVETVARAQEEAAASGETGAAGAATDEVVVEPGVVSAPGEGEEEEGPAATDTPPAPSDVDAPKSNGRERAATPAPKITA